MSNGLIFIACGQLTDREKTLGLSIEKLLKKYNVDTFFAEIAHDLEDLNSHIFKNIDSGTGFVAILHRRNKIDGSKFDTSVWINQEIAIAAFLKFKGKEIPSLILLEEGAEQEGLIKYTIANPLQFKSDEEALSIIDTWAKEKDFKPKKSSTETSNSWILEARERAR